MGSSITVAYIPTYRHEGARAAWPPEKPLCSDICASFLHVANSCYAAFGTNKWAKRIWMFAIDHMWDVYRARWCNSELDRFGGRLKKETWEDDRNS